MHPMGLKPQPHFWEKEEASELELNAFKVKPKIIQFCHKISCFTNSIKAYPQSYKDTVRISDADSVRSYNSTTPLLVPTARSSCSEATEVHTASPEPNLFSALIDSACFTPFLLTEHDTSCPSEYNTNSNLNGRQSSSWIIADLLEILWSDTITPGAPPEAKPLSREFGIWVISLISHGKGSSSNDP